MKWSKFILKISYLRLISFQFLLPAIANVLRNLRNSWNIGLLFTATGGISGGTRFGCGVKISRIRGLTIGRNLRLGDFSKILIDHQNKTLQEPKVELGSNVKIGDRNQIGAGSGQSFFIGDYTSTHAGCYIFGDVYIGRACLFSANIFASSGDHHYKIEPFLFIKDQDRFFSCSPPQRITVEDDCWVGWGAVLKRGISVGKGSVIGANSVVTSNVPPYSVVAGAPAKIIKKRLDFNPTYYVDLNRQETYPYLYRGFRILKSELSTLDSKVVCALSESNWAVFENKEYKSLSISLWSKKETGITVGINGGSTSLKLNAGWNAFDLAVAEFSKSSHFEIPPLLQNYFPLLLSLNEREATHQSVLLQRIQLN